ncbi:MAG: hypothetical protein QOG65_697 [Actinomycetota bacterium]|nr:hypothetical protein [Actinomycetota bacterium]
MTSGRLWARMNELPRRAAAQLSERDVPASPGVYAWYRNAEAVYSGRATGRKGLRTRIWHEQLKTGSDLSYSSFRREVCAHLGVGPTIRSLIRPSVLTAVEVEVVNEWILGCEVAWIECTSATEAERLEQLLHAEWTPSLSRR